MTPPTSLTFIIHILVVIIRKILTLFSAKKNIAIESRECKEFIPVGSANRATRAYSVAVILLVGVYMSWLVILFVGRAVEDSHANWKVAGKTMQATTQVILDIQTLNHEYAKVDSVSQDVKVSEKLYVPHHFFSDKASPYISFYTQNIQLPIKK